MHSNNPDAGVQHNKPWPSHFVLRDTGKGKVKAVPLIAVDELPATLHIAGVPRSFELDEAVGMLNLGLHKESESYYHVTRAEARVQEAKTDKTLLESIHNPNAKPRVATAKPQPSTASTTPKPPPNSPKSSSPPSEPANTMPRNQQHCHHWCKHGICKWGQNCHYRHIMPMTQDGLHEVGLTDWPIWYQKRNPGLVQSDITAPPLSKRAARRGAVSEGGRMVGGHVVGRKWSGFEDGNWMEICKMLKKELMKEREKVAKKGKETEKEKESGIEANEKIAGGVKKGVKGRRAVKAPAVEDVRGLDDRIVKRATGRWEDDESGDDSDISSLPSRREVATSESEKEKEKEKRDVKAKENLVDV